jgi:hypothetical protein
MPSPVLALAAATLLAGPPPAPVGVARVDVTPTHPTVLAGFGSRAAEHISVAMPLHARALALGDPDPVVLVAVENCGVPAPVVAEAARRLTKEAGLPTERLVVASTHTHNAPALEGYAPVLWKGRSTPGFDAHTAEYTRFLTDKIFEVAKAALAARAPAHLAWGTGRVGFGGNRRVLAGGKWAGFGWQKDGPVDHDLPVLVARDDAGKVVALWTTYACHCTTLGDVNAIHPDWAGLASRDLEAAHPGAVAIVTIGCGAVVGPQPSGTADHAAAHGRALADEVARLLGTGLEPVEGPIRVASTRVELPLAPVPGRDPWQKEAQRQGFEGQHARLQLERLDRGEALPTSVPCRIDAWHFARGPAIVFLPGEVVVDHAVRLKREHPGGRLWLNAWSHDVPCYVPSRRVLDEGGYEPDFSMIYYGWPARFAPGVEDRLVEGVREALAPP